MTTNVSSAFYLLTACSVDDLACGVEEAGASTKRISKPSHFFSSSYSSSAPLPTIQEKFLVDETGNVLSNSSDLYHNSQISVENGKHCQNLMSAEELQEVRCLPKVPRSVSFSCDKVRQKISSNGVKLGLSSPRPEAPVAPDMVDFLLPAINVEQHNDRVQYR